MARERHIGFWGVVAIGVGGMVGGGIFAVLGLSVQLARGAAPIAFAIGGVVTLLTAYSYTKLSVAFPSQGGTVIFLDRAFKPNLVVGSLNILLWFSYIVMLSLYSYAFGSYGSAFASEAVRPWLKHILISLSIVGISGLNMLSADLIGRAEVWIVGLKIAILMFFVAVGIFATQVSQLAPATWAPPLHIIAGGMIIFLAYEGFELIANTAHDVKDPSRTLPKAFFTAVIFVILLYILVAAVTAGSLSLDRIVAAKDYALAEAARPFLGQFGFWMIAVAALLSTGSAINATLYGAARLSYTIAKEGELPALLERKVWHRPVEGLLITAAVTLVLANVFDLSSISTMGSAGFLLIFAAVNGANWKMHRDTKSSAWISAVGSSACFAALAVLLWQTAVSAPGRILILVAMVVLAVLVELLYLKLRGHAIRLPVLRPFFHHKEQESARE